MENLGKLSVVATPIGNMGDITLRAIETLRNCDVIFCEDTRMTGKLLERLGLPKKDLVRADAEKESSASTYAIQLLNQGKHLVYVSDAGTPGVSDPGGRMVERVRSEAPHALVEAIPGVSSVTAALSISGLNSDGFTFLGFVPHKKGRETFFKSLATFPHPTIFFESPHRIIKTLESLAQDYPEATIYLGRELTKMHEEMLIGLPAEIIDIIKTNSVKQKGEFVLIVELN